MSILERNNVKIWGSGTRPMLFVHGFGCDQHLWRLMTPRFEDDYRVVVFDQVGAGRSDLSSYDPEKYSTLDGYATDVIEIVEELDLKDVILVGHSVSAMIGLLAAKRASERFSDLIMIGPSPRYIDDGDYVGGFTRDGVEELLQFFENNHLGWAAAMAPVIMGNENRPELAQELETSFCAADPEIARIFARVTFLSDNRADLPGVTTSTLIIQTQDDVIAPVPVGEYCHKHIPGSKYVLIDATGHCAHLSAPEMTTYLAER